MNALESLIVATAKQHFLTFLYLAKDLTFEELYNLLDSFNLQKNDDGTALFDFNFESLCGTLYFDGKSWSVGRTFDIYFGECTSPIVTAEMRLENGELIYEELCSWR